jgi:hypothetical protein
MDSVQRLTQELQIRSEAGRTFHPCARVRAAFNLIVSAAGSQERRKTNENDRQRLSMTTIASL